MKILIKVTLVGALLFLHPSGVLGQAKAKTEIFLLEDTQHNQWCAYSKEASWNTAVHDTEAVTVGALIYLNDHLSQIDVTQTDESGDWTAYDHYFLNGRDQIVKLSRMINILPGDRSVLQTFSVSDGKAKKTGTTEKELSTGKLLTSPKSLWLPDLTVETAPQMFPFSDLLGHPNLKTASKTCIHVLSK